jgi:hypothetical protein
MRIASAVLLAACSQPHPIVMCHNANCAEPIDPAIDDTLAALGKSLALTDNGRPVIDGIELDSFFRDSDLACLYAHDPTDFSENTPAVAPAQQLATHFADAGDLTYGGGTFHVLMELKPSTAPEHRMLHAQCAWDIYTTIANAAVANNRDVVVEIESFAPELLSAMIAIAPAQPPIPYVYGAVQSLPPPLDTDTRPLSDYTGLPLEFVELHDQWIYDDQYEAVRSMHAKLHMFMFSATTETFAAIRRYEPESVTTSEARLMRRWIER